nr:FCD domain-containing protein [Jannaschia seohaensis]
MLAAGTHADETGDTAEQVRQDRALHALVYETSGNPLLASTAEPHWQFLQRAMGEVLRRAKLPKEIWRQHAEIADAIAAGDPDRAERLMTEHDLDAARTLAAALVASLDASTDKDARA